MSRMASIGDGTDNYAADKYLGLGQIVEEDYDGLHVPGESFGSCYGKCLQAWGLAHPGVITLDMVAVVACIASFTPAPQGKEDLAMNRRERSLRRVLGVVMAALALLVASRATAGWIYAHDGTDKLALFKQQGMNALITHARDGDTFTHWAQEAKKAGMRLFGVVSASFDVEKTGMRRCVFGNGYQSVVPCPLDERYWDEVLTNLAVRTAKDSRQPDREISGILIDWEMYVNSGKGGQSYYTDACYCDHCFGAFLKHKSQPDACSQVAFRDRAKWLKEKKRFEEYHPYLQSQVKGLASQLREQVAAVSPDFFVGFYPVPHNWHLKGVAQGLGTPQHPMILWATSTYSGRGPSKISDNWKQELRAEGIHCYYSGGMLLRSYSAANLSKNLFEIARKTDGYWLFTVHTLCIRDDEHSGDYYLAAGSRDDYLKAIKAANSELDQLATNPDYLTPLKSLPEPVRYRHTGFDVNRYHVPQVLDRSTVGRGQPQTLPPLTLAGSNFLVMMLQAGEEPSLSFDVNRNQPFRAGAAGNPAGANASHQPAGTARGGPAD